MPAAIKDEFATVADRRRRYQLRNKAEGLCVLCRCPSEGKAHCPACREVAKRKRDEAKKR